MQMTLGTIVGSPTRSVESRLKSPEKGKIKILLEYIEADPVIRELQ
jgi:hypothetical protein